MLVAMEHTHDTTPATRHSARWLPVAWSLARPHLPAGGTVVDLGCGPLGGCVPALLDAGYDAVGIDPSAPPGDRYQVAPFEDADVPDGVAAIIATMSLHHVGDLDQIVELARRALAPEGTLIVLEMDWPAFNDVAAQWCFDRLESLEADEPGGWLATQRANWLASGQSWTDYRTAWATEHGLHTGAQLLGALDAHFDRIVVEASPYYFSQLVDDVTPEVELAAVAAGELPQAAFKFVGRPK